MSHDDAPRSDRRPPNKPIYIPPSEPEDQNPHAAPPAELLQGYDSIGGAGRSTAVEGKIRDLGGDSSVSYMVCMGISELSDALEIDQSFSVGFGPFFSATEKMKFVKKLKVTTNSITIVAIARHVERIEVSKDDVLRSDVKPPEDDLRNFVRQYGDSYLSKVEWGGEYFAVYSFRCQTREEQEQVHAGLDAAGLIKIVSVDAGVQSKLESFVSTTNTNVFSTQYMSGIKNPAFPNHEDMMDFANEFPKLELTAPTTISFTTTGYEKVTGVDQDKFTPIQMNREYFIGTKGSDGGLAGKLVQVQQLKDQIHLVQSIYDFYGGYQDDELLKIGEQARADIDEISEQMRSYEGDPAQPFQEPPLPSLAPGLPVLDYFIGEWKHGFANGKVFTDIDPTTAAMEKTRITHLQLYYNKNITQLVIGYSSVHRGKWTATHGPNGGKSSDLLTLGESDQIKIMKGSERTSGLISQLSFTLGNGRSVSGGNVSDSEFEDALLSGGPFFLGFGGRIDKELGQIIFYIAEFQPAKWKKR